jgi:AcrR family transcriptional regulator
LGAPERGSEQHREPHCDGNQSHPAHKALLLSTWKLFSDDPYRFVYFNVMEAAPIPAVKTRGRPRSWRAEAAILKATRELLAEQGLAAMTIEEVASRAGVGKASIYRRWPNKAAVALDAFVDDYLAGIPVRDTGTLRGDLLASARDWIRVVTRTPAGRTLAALLAEALTEPKLAAAWRDVVLHRLRDDRRAIISRAIARGEVSAEIDADLILDLFYGALYHRFVNGHLPLTERFARALAIAVTAAAAAGTQTSARASSSM